MPYFKAKLHQIWFWLGIRSWPHDNVPHIPGWIIGVLLLRHKRKQKGKGEEERKEKGEENAGKGIITRIGRLSGIKTWRLKSSAGLRLQRIWGIHKLY